MRTTLLLLLLRWAVSAEELAIRWVHIPKCGQSFAIVMYHFGCRADVAREATTFLTSSRAPGKVLEAERRFNVTTCCCADADARDGRRRRVVPPLGGRTRARAADRGRGGVATVVREPAQRYLSAQRYFGRATLGEQTLLLTGRRAARGATGAELAARAAAAVEDDHAVLFVGVMEHWAASVALFHCRFMAGAPPAPEEMLNIHPGAELRRAHADVAAGVGARAPSRYDAAALGVAAPPADPADEALYEAARRRLARELREHAECVCGFEALRDRIAAPAWPGEDNSTIMACR